MYINPALGIDFYKADHRRQYPEGTEYVYSNFTPRSDRLMKMLPKYWDGKAVFFGLQGFLQWYITDVWNANFFNMPKDQVVAVYKARMDMSLGQGAIDTQHIEDLHDLGYLPIEVKALPEGSLVDMGVPFFTLENTDERFFWITNYLETVFSAEIWKPVVNATIAHQYKRLLTSYAEATGAPLEGVDIQGHDFSFRGMSGIFDAASSGAGHLLSFIGTDTVPAIDYLASYYLPDMGDPIGVSVPASEHSVMCAGTKESEINTFRRFINELYPKGIVSIVSDTWDFWQVITEFAVELKDDILARQPNELGLAKTVFRPDSGDPVKILCGYNVKDLGKRNKLSPYELEELVLDYDYELFKIDGVLYDVVFDYFPDGSPSNAVFVASNLTEPEIKGAVECLYDIFGGELTDKGFKQLHERVGLIYGDSITLERAEEIMSRLQEKGFASNCVVLGIGSYTYQMNTRDTLGMAMKATHVVVNGEGRDIFKDPKTDSGEKKSAKGRLAVVRDGDNLKLLQGEEAGTCTEDLLEKVYANGAFFKKHKLSDIRSRLKDSL